MAPGPADRTAVALGIPAAGAAAAGTPGTPCTPDATVGRRGDHTVVASCHNHPDITDHQIFTVTATVTTTVSGLNSTSVVSVTSSAELTPVPPTTTVPTKDGHDTSDLASYWWVLVVIAVAIAVLVASYRLRPPKPPPVHAVSRVAGPPRVTVRETPAPGESTHALRLETHSGADTLTVEEVNDGHIPAE